VADWRFLRRWSAAELTAELRTRRRLGLNYDLVAPRPVEDGWRSFGVESSIAHESPGLPEPGGAYERAWRAVESYAFSDPRIVVGHFDVAEPLEGRTMLLELKALGFRFLAGTRVTATRRERTELETVRGFRYDTLRGHIEAGWEWFVLTKSHATGEVRFRIEAEWRQGDFPNWWSRLGFRLLGRHYQRRWTRRAQQRLRRAAGPGQPPRAGDTVVA
jgi:uncharacterized protein (UPF0548 family)